MDRRTVLVSGGGLGVATALGGWFGHQRSSAEVVRAPSPGVPRLGINPTSISYASPLALIDRIKASSEWGYYGTPTPTNALGFPTGLGGHPMTATMVPCEPGTYILTHDGDLDVRLLGASIKSQGHGRVVFEAGSAIEYGRQFILYAIRRTPTFMHLVKQEDAASFAKGEQFTPAFLAQLRGFDTIRFMDWMRTNGSTVTDRYTPVEACSYADGMPIAVITALASKVGAHPWICIPHLASDDLARRMIEDARSGMAGGPAPYLEYSNEVWNTGFEQARYAVREAPVLGGGATGATFYGYKAGKLAMLARGSGCRVVLGCQTVVSARADQIWDGVRRAGASDRYFYGWMIATYVAGTLTSRQGPTLALAARHDVAGAVDNILHSVDPGALSVATMRRIYAEHGAIAAAHRLELLAYEGNLHLNALPGFGGESLKEVQSFFAEIARDARAGEVMDANLSAFGAAGGRLACLYNLSSGSGAYGTFGLVDSGAWNAVQRRLSAGPR